MTAFVFRFPAGRYHATPWGRHANEADVAWPPEPARILRALVAIWWRKADRMAFPKALLNDLIDSLATRDPAYHLPEAVHAHLRAYMPMDTLDPASGRPRRTLIYDAFLRLDPGAELAVVWPDLTLAADQSTLAVHLLERMGYLGRAESWVLARFEPAWTGALNCRPRDTDVPRGGAVPVEVAAPVTPEAWRSERPARLAEAARLAKSARRTVEATLPERLADALAIDTLVWQQAGWSAPPPLRRVVYDRPPVGPVPPSGAPRRFAAPVRADPTVARFVLAGRPRPRVEETLRIGEIARLALMSRTNGDLPVFSGRSGNGPLRSDPRHGHAFFLPEDADDDGLIDHLVVHARGGFDAAARRALDGLRVLWIDRRYVRQGADALGRDEADDGGRREWRLALEGFGEPETFRDSPLLRPSSTWQSATPYLKPWHDDEGGRTVAERTPAYRAAILREWRLRRPEDAEPEISPLGDGYRFEIRIAGAPRGTLGFVRTRGRRGGPQPDTAGGFFRLALEAPLSGPLAFGWGCHFGLGLFLAER